MSESLKNHSLAAITSEGTKILSCSKSMWELTRDAYLSRVSEGGTFETISQSGFAYPLFGASAEGCWLDCSRGIYITGEVIKIAIEYGLDVSGESEDTLSGTEEYSYDYLSYIVEPFLQQFAEEGFSFGYHPDWGDWGLYRDDTDDEEDDTDDEEDDTDDFQDEIAYTMSFEEFVTAYLVCALWSTHDWQDGEDNPHNFDTNGYTIDDFDPVTLADMRSDCKKFFDTHRELIGDHIEQAGHDFWLTREHHGVGFWDREEVYGKEAAKTLTDASHVFGEYDLYSHEGKVCH